MTWLIVLLFDPAEALDWRDANNKIDHGKCVPDCVLAVLLVLQVIVCLHTMRLPDFIWGVIDLTAAFGYPAWRAFLRQRTATASASITGNVTEILHTFLPSKRVDNPDQDAPP